MRALRHPWDLMLLGAASFAGTLAYIHYTRVPVAVGIAGVTIKPRPATAAETALPASVSSPAAAATEDQTAIGERKLDELLAEATGDFADQRLAAIAALADAPRDRAMPVLLRIAEQGVVGADRHAALDALLAQARRRPDADGAIHGLLRDLVYDGNDEDVSDHAARVLEQLDTGASS